MRFCSVLQKELLHLPWPEEVLSWLACGEVRDAASGNTIWRGLRVRMGMAYGRPDYRKPLNTGGRQALCWRQTAGAGLGTEARGLRSASMCAAVLHTTMSPSRQVGGCGLKLGSCIHLCIAGLQGLSGMICTTKLSCSTAQLQSAQCCTASSRPSCGGKPWQPRITILFCCVLYFKQLDGMPVRLQCTLSPVAFISLAPNKSLRDVLAKVQLPRGPAKAKVAPLGSADVTSKPVTVSLSACRAR